MTKVIITRGLPGSGKSTWSKKWVANHPSYVRINRDDIRLMMHSGVYNLKREISVLVGRKAMIKQLILSGADLVLDESHMSDERLYETLLLLRHMNLYPSIEITYKIKDFTDIDLDTCIKRDAKRKGKEHVGAYFITKYYNKYVKNKPKKEEKWTILS